MQDLMKFLNARKSAYHTNPKLIDEVIYSPYSFPPAGALHASVQSDNGSSTPRTGDLLGIPELRAREGDDDTGTMRKKKRKSKFDAHPQEAEIFLFEYGTVVIWGMTEVQEKRFLSSMSVILLADRLCG
jgi:uncharacterized Rmd1/YagE family protein